MLLLKKYSLLLVLAMAPVLSCLGQLNEFNCKVQIISPSLQLSASDKIAVEEMTQQIRDFMNNTRWSTETYKIEERIDLNILINLSEQSAADEFGGTIQVTSSRPVFGTNYKSTVFNYIDNDFKFRYQRGAAIQFSIDRHRDNLSSVLGFYAYMMLGYDYDSFSKEGGTKYFVKAQQICTNAQGVTEPGWRAAEGQKNRYWMVENALQQLFQPLREANYKYHRLGFDVLYSNTAAGTAAVYESLELIQKVFKARPGSFNVQLFFSTKVNELVDLFKGAQPEMKTKAYNLLKSLDAANLNKYNKINQ